MKRSDATTVGASAAKPTGKKPSSKSSKPRGTVPGDSTSKKGAKVGR